MVSASGKPVCVVPRPYRRAGWGTGAGEHTGTTGRGEINVDFLQPISAARGLGNLPPSIFGNPKYPMLLLFSPPPKKGEKMTQINGFRAFVAPLGAPEKITPFATLSCRFHSFLKSKMISFPFKRGAYS